MDTVSQTIHSRTNSTPWGVYYGIAYKWAIQPYLDSIDNCPVQPGPHLHLGEVRHSGVQALPKDFSQKVQHLLWIRTRVSRVLVQLATTGPLTTYVVLGKTNAIVEGQLHDIIT